MAFAAQIIAIVGMNLCPAWHGFQSHGPKLKLKLNVICNTASK